ncbi:MAG: hypothetical protein RLY20_2864 [Verrucomicrobiota bacterium]|jgi:protein involved in polysaccharide export with SLBB domain
MKRYLVTPALAAILAISAQGATSSGFIPISPDGFPLAASNSPPAAVTAQPQPIRPSVPLPLSVTNLPAAAAKTADSGSELDDRHKIAAGDKVSFAILEDRYLPNLSDNRAITPLPSPSDLSKPLIVADTGELDVPYVGRVLVAGRTCKDIAAELKVLLERDYYFKATVVLGLDQMSRVQGRVYVSGEVRNAGPVSIPPNENFTVGKAILGAGGFTEWAKKSKVQVVRAPKPGQPAVEPIIVDMEQVLEKGRADKDVPLEPEDYIIVPRAVWHM